MSSLMRFLRIASLPRLLQPCSRLVYSSSRMAFEPVHMALHRSPFRFAPPSGFGFSSGRTPVDLDFGHVLWPSEGDNETEKCLALFKQTFNLKGKFLWWDIQNFGVQRSSIPIIVQKIKNLVKEQNLSILVFGEYDDMGKRLIKFLRGQGYFAIAIGKGYNVTDQWIKFGIRLWIADNISSPNLMVLASGNGGFVHVMREMPETLEGIVIANPDQLDKKYLVLEKEKPNIRVFTRNQL